MVLLCVFRQRCEKRRNRLSGMQRWRRTFGNDKTTLSQSASQAEAAVSSSSCKVGAEWSPRLPDRGETDARGELLSSWATNTEPRSSLSPTREPKQTNWHRLHVMNAKCWQVSNGTGKDPLTRSRKNDPLSCNMSLVTPPQSQRRRTSWRQPAACSMSSAWVLIQSPLLNLLRLVIRRTDFGIVAHLGGARISRLLLLALEHQHPFPVSSLSLRNTCSFSLKNSPYQTTVDQRP